MQEFLNWTIDIIRSDNLIGSWLEEKKFEWTPLTSKIISSILYKNCAVLIVTDGERDWFKHYLLTSLNNPKLGRPYFPFYDFKGICPNIDSLKNDEDVNLIRDMLGISFPQGYCFWYIGRGNSHRANFPKVSKNSYLWLIDEEMPNSFMLRGNDDALELKLLQMFRLFNKSLSAALFAEVFVDR